MFALTREGDTRAAAGAARGGEGRGEAREGCCKSNNLYATLFFVVVVQVAQLRFPFTSVLQVVAVAVAAVAVVAAAVVVVAVVARMLGRLPWPACLWPEVR